MVCYAWGVTLYAMIMLCYAMLCYAWGLLLCYAMLILMHMLCYAMRGDCLYALLILCFGHVVGPHACAVTRPVLYAMLMLMLCFWLCFAFDAELFDVTLR